MIKTGIETGVLGCGLIRPASGIVITKNIYTRYSDFDAKVFLYTSTASGNQNKESIYTLVRDLKIAGIWDRCIAIYPFIGGTATTFRPNLMSSTQYPLTFNGGATFSRTGYLPNGTSGFANTGINANARLTQSNAHLSFYSRTNAAAETRVSIGAIVGSSSPLISLQLRNAGGNAVAQNATGASAESAFFANSNSQGFYVNSKTSSAIGGLSIYKNGVAQASNTVATSVNNYPSTNILIGAYSATTFFDNKECAFASVGLGFTAAQIADYTAIVNNFQIIQERNV